MGAFDFLGNVFGGNQQPVTTQQGPPQWASGYWAELFNRATNELAAIPSFNRGEGAYALPQYYPNSTVAGFTPVQSGAMYGMGQAAAGGQASVVNTAADTATRQLATGGNPYNDPNFLTTMGAIGDQATRNFTNSVMPQLDLGALSAGQFGGGRQGVVQNEAVDRFGQSLGEELSKFGSQSYATNLDATMRALALAPQTAQATTMPWQTLLDIGNLQQQQQQNEINADVERWNYDQTQNQRAIDRYFSQVLPALGLGSTTQTEGPTTSPLLQSAGMAMMGGLVGNKIWGTEGGGWGAGLGALIGLFG